MKKIIIVTHKIVMGGVERALIGMLKNMPKDSYDITLMVREHGRELYNSVPSGINIKGVFDNEESVK